MKMPVKALNLMKKFPFDFLVVGNSRYQVTGWTDSRDLIVKKVMMCLEYPIELKFDPEQHITMRYPLNFSIFTEYKTFCYEEQPATETANATNQ